ncbi:SIR2 family protein [Mesorhizobium sp. 113-3-3]|uniref:SIR2 family protein n=1 Tax=Mesorhizobium sp. 113-3-3 TaxID=2744516 RepID=UPI001926D081|nr:SIR2 family protein [Mesorhizobium sp. 113-3-3]BCG79880.1 hypothetical protein MesoLj113b_34220 [Mesorhizobium sp. 113-3-3]
MSLLAGDLTTQLAFSMFENRGIYALLLGSGLSRAAGIPTGWEITLDLVRRVALAKGVEDRSDWATWYRDEIGGAPDYSTLLEELAASPAERRSILHSYIEPDEEERSEGKKLPTAAHHAIARLVRDGYVRVIVTTNFDRLLENALREAGIEPTVVSSVDALSGAEPLTHSACYVLKLHGDYKDARILNTDEELGGYPAPYDALLNRIFDEHGLVICGWSGEWDHALRAALLRAPNRRYPIFWTLRGDPGTGAEEIIRSKKAQIVRIADADTFFTSTGQRIETLATTRKQNPLSVDLFVSTAKRYLARAEHRIQLDDLVSREAERVAKESAAEEFSANASWSADNFRTRVARYESMSEALAKAAGAMGRWGEGNEAPLVADLIRTLVTRANKVRSGNTFLLGLREYPAVLIFTAYGLGLCRSQRWRELHNLFSLNFPDSNGNKSKRLVETLFLWEWEGHDRDAWRNIEGFEGRKTPLSDHLLDIFTDWSRPFIGLSSDFELLFDRFETLGSLAHLDSTSEAALTEALADQNDFIHPPMGRILWRTQSFRALEDEILTNPMRDTLIEAGFAGGRTSVLELQMKNLKRLAGYMRRY